jgi:hypothetical protein
MRIPFLTGFLERRRQGRDRARIVLPEGKLPTPIPGPWVLRALVREGGADASTGDAASATSPAPSAPAPTSPPIAPDPPCPPAETPPEGPPGS